MNALFTIGIVLLILFLLHRQRIVNKRNNLSTDLRILYDKLEFTIIKNNVRPDNKLLKYLKNYKILAVNPSLADIQVLLSIIARTDPKVLECKRNQKAEYDKTLPIETVEIAKRFNGTVNRMIKLSMWKPDFVFYLAWFVFPVLFKNGLRGLRDVVSRYYANIKNEVFIVSSPQDDLVYC